MTTSITTARKLAEAKQRREAAYEFAIAQGGAITANALAKRFRIHCDRAREVLKRARNELHKSLAEKDQPPTPKRRFLAVIGDRMVYPLAVRAGDKVDRFTVEVM